ncbi:hypothetical protein [Phytohabitans rumicis]|uniref:Uncharacterized protein n=1 Tax=Phytohabitans rumicis TaxID=1076125 RepID=A0A6V8KWF0_9ACTN|nr:hypothetical protein [Phytohabitans rumicis]GFJ86721.1 hypothetical protein Prum_003630 [Phytohabitans rumicis]
MAETMLGGDVNQIREAASAYRLLGDHLVSSGGQVTATTDGLVAGLQEQLSSARATLMSTLQGVNDESRAAVSKFGGIMWTGANRAQVEEVSAELDAHVNETTARIQGIIEAFGAELDRLGAELTDVSTQFNAVAVSAGESAVSLGDAMDAQANQLDDVMNTGVTRV